MTQRRAPGFTLLELLIVVIIIAILYSRVPDLYTQLRGPRGVRARSDAGMLAAGLWGPTPDYQGFVGDISLASGAFPPSVATEGISDDLVFPQSGTFAQPWNVLGVTGGWNGPYAGFESNGLTKDPWGNAWTINTAGQVVSAGPDGVPGNTDDLKSPVASPMLLGTTGTVTVSVRDPDGLYLNSNYVNVYLWQTVQGSTPRGTVQRYQLQYDSTIGCFSSASALGPVTILPGRHAVEAVGTNLVTPTCDNFSQGSCTALYGHGVVYVLGNGVASIEIRMHD